MPVAVASNLHGGVRDEADSSPKSVKQEPSDLAEPRASWINTCLQRGRLRPTVTKNSPLITVSEILDWHREGSQVAERCAVIEW